MKIVSLSIFLLLFLSPSAVFARHKTKRIDVKFGDESWMLYLNERRTLIISGTWEGNPHPIIVDKLVDNVWGIGNSFGPTIIYMKGVEMRWLMLRGDDGEKIMGGTLLYATGETGFVESVAMKSILDGDFVKVFFDNRKYTEFKIGTNGRKDIVRQGSAESP